MKIRDWAELVVAVAICEGAGAVGSLAAAPVIGSGWYARLAAPALLPPPWAFGPVWIALYALMGVALWMVWGKRSAAPQARRWALLLFALQLGFNVRWPILFFSYHAPGWALVEIIALWLAVAATIIAFARVSRPAAWLMAPYLVWVSFALYLNFAIWLFN